MTDRPLLTKDLDRCEWHPERGTVGWRDVIDETGARVDTVGVCEECAAMIDTSRVPVMLPVST